MYYQPELKFAPDDVIVYLRKSRSDDPLMSVEEVLAKHEGILDEWSDRYLKANVPEENKYREVVSGETIADRPEIQKVLKLVESPKYKAILCVEVQRLSRGDLEDAGRLIKLLRYTNTLIITPSRTYDLKDEYDRDAFERELKRGNEYLEYTKKIMNRGRLDSVSHGNYIANVPPYGYDKTWVMDGRRKCPTLKENTEQANIVRLVFDLYVSKDMGVTNIAHYLDSLGVKPRKGGEHWSPAFLKNMLTNEHYIGKVVWNRRKRITTVEDGEFIKRSYKAKDGDYLIFEGKHDALISEELFYAAQEKRGKHHRAKPNTKVRNPFAGLLYCQCGFAMSLRTYRKDGVERAAPRLICDAQTHCKSGSCLYDEMLVRISDILKECIRDIEFKIGNKVDDSAELHMQLIKSLEKKLQDLQAKELAQWEAQADPNLETRMPAHIFRQLNDKLLKEKNEVEHALRKAYDVVPEPVNYEEKLITFKQALASLYDEEISAEVKNRLLKSCIERIDYHRERPQLIRAKSKKRVTVNGRKLHTNGLKTGANWTTTTIELDVKLKV